MHVEFIQHVEFRKQQNRISILFYESEREVLFEITTKAHCDIRYKGVLAAIRNYL